MKSKTVCAVFFSFLSFSSLAKTSNSLCAGVTGATFTSGDGSTASPYLICNKLQMSLIGINTTLLNKNFILGADLNFNGTAFQMLGSQTNPFQGSFEGNSYTISSISLPMGGNNIAIFPRISNAKISNLQINGVTIDSTNLGSKVGGLVALAENSTLTNINLRDLNMRGTDYSGGLIGQAQNSTISKSLIQGEIHQTSGTDAGGGFIGYAINCQVSSCASHVNIIQQSEMSFGVSNVGAFFGLATQCTVSNSYADGNIDYSSVTDIIPGMLAHQFGGLFGAGSGTITNSYYAGKMIALDPDKAREVGGAAGAFAGTSSGVFWDTTLSGMSQSAVGLGLNTCAMQQKSFWLTQGYDQAIWLLADGAYPKLRSEN